MKSGLSQFLFLHNNDNNNNSNNNNNNNNNDNNNNNIIMNAADKCHNNFGGDRSPGTIRKDWRKTSNMFPGKLKMHQLQKNTCTPWINISHPKKDTLYQIDLCFILIGWPYKWTWLLCCIINGRIKLRKIVI